MVTAIVFEYFFQLSHSSRASNPGAETKPEATQAQNPASGANSDKANLSSDMEKPLWD